MRQEVQARGAGESRREASAIECKRLLSESIRRAELPKLAALRDEAALREASNSGSTMQAVEWCKLPVMTRVVFLLVAGIDGESETLALKSWNEFNLPEQAGIQSAMSQLRSALIGAQALCRS